MTLRFVCAAALVCAATSLASGLEDHGVDLYPREKLDFALNGYFRARGDLLHNLDLDRGLTPSGEPLFVVPVSDPTSQLIAAADMRLRTDLSIFAPFAAVAVRMRVDVLDDLTLGSTPIVSPGAGSAPIPAASPGQIPSSLFRIKRAYAEALTPVGFITAGRMGNHWGLGMLSHGGDCIDCNLGDSVDRIAFSTSIADHLWAIAYDFSAVETSLRRKDGQRSLIFDPATNVNTVTFAIMNVRSDISRDRRLAAGKASFEYGAFASYRWQDFDIPTTYVATSQPLPITPTSVTQRGYRAGAFDVFFRLTTRYVRVRGEGALLMAESQPSLIPGLILRDKAQSFQMGGALEVDVGDQNWRINGGLNVGAASGDPAPGFGAFPGAKTKTQAGDLDGPQIDMPRDTRVDNFRFHPDYRIDRILFAEIIGTVTDALYVRPWAKFRLLDFSSAKLILTTDATFSRSIFATSTPGNDVALGAEVHASLAWENKDGFNVMAEYAVLFPLAGFNNAAQSLIAAPAQLARLRLGWVF